MKIQQNPTIPSDVSSPTFIQALFNHFRAIASQVNALSDGYVAASNAVALVTDISGQHAKGDFVRNNSPSELGIAGSKYIVLGWVCVTAGNPGTWKECRTLTGA